MFLFLPLHLHIFFIICFIHLLNLSIFIEKRDLGLLLQSLICGAHFRCVKLRYIQRDKIGFLRITSGQFGKFVQLPTET